MGVPKFYRRVSELLPLINQAIEETTLLVEQDNLYLDLNGVIHTATHGNEGVSKKLSEKDIALAMITYIDMMVKIIKPQRLLYMAIDGCAPRAKMNQQRSRRFRAARDAIQARSEALAAGEEIHDEDIFDSNCITPGTEFMSKVSGHLTYFVRQKMKSDLTWQKFKVIFSGAECPGEGEHKIVQYIRAAKLEADYDPNTRHCMAGLDADLVMLALATHEPHFTLLREQVDFNANRANKFGTKTKQVRTSAVKWQVLHIGLFREYLEMLLRPDIGAENMSFAYDGERVIDDFVLIAALCGNDFMPHLPSLDIGEGALDVLCRTYRENLPRWGGYLCEGGLIKFDRLEEMLVVMGRMEAQIFKARAEEADKFAKRAEKETKRARANAVRAAGAADEDGAGGDENGGDSEAEDGEISKAAEAAAQAELLRALARRLAAERAANGGGLSIAASASGISDPGESSTDESDVEPEAFVLDEEDFKGRYYLDKFGISYRRGSPQDDAMLESIVRCYAEALQWVMLYYFRGVPSWGWFYPFHYAPMTSDLVSLSKFRITFRLGQPFRPYQQLLGCLPAASSDFLPKPYKALMCEAWSPIISSYPPLDEIKIDMNGKRNSWEGVTLIPFMKEKDMLDAVIQYCPDSALTPDEIRRNSFGNEYIIWHDPSSAETVKSFNSSIFPDIPHGQSRMQVYNMRRLPVLTPPGTALPVDASADVVTAAENREMQIEVKEGMRGTSSMFFSNPLPGCIVPAPGYPTLHTLPLSPALKDVGIDVFGSKSKKESLILAIGARVLTPEEQEEEMDAELHVAAGSGGGGGRGHAHHSSGPRVHKPCFSTTYTSGTTVSSLQSGAASAAAGANDVLTQWQLENRGKRVSAREIAPSILGKVMYCDWPHLRECRVVSVEDASTECSWDESQAAGSSISIKALSPDEQVRFSQDATYLHRALLSGGRGLKPAGIRTNEVEVIVTVRKLEGMRRDPVDGSLSRVFAQAGSDLEMTTPASLLFASHPNPDPRFQEKGARTLADRFPVGAEVMVLRGAARGCPAKVVGYTTAASSGSGGGAVVGASDGSSIQGALVLDAEVPAPEPPFGANIRDQIFDAYFDGRRASQALRINDRVFSKISGSVLVKSGTGFKATVFDIGLNLKVQRNLFLPGYVRPVTQVSSASAWAAGVGKSTAIAAAPARTAANSGGWEYTERAVALVAAYQREFPEVFGLLDAAPDQPAYAVRDFPGGADALVHVMTWLHQLETWNKPLVPLTTAVLSPRAVQACEVAAARWAAHLITKAAAAAGKKPDDPDVKTTKTTRVASILPCDILRQEAQAYAVGSVGEGESSLLTSTNVDGPGMTPVLGDRVVNLSYKRTPLGLRGIVVAVHSYSGYVEVVFDEEFVGGTSLGGVCSTGKGALVPWSALLCLSRLPGDATPSVTNGVSSTSTPAVPEGYDRSDAGPKGKQGRISTSNASSGPAAAGASGQRQAQPQQQQQQQPQRQPQQPQKLAQQQQSRGPAAGGRAAGAPGVAAGPTTGGGFARNQNANANASPSPRFNEEAAIEQLEFYFSDRNLAGDKFMREKMAEDSSREGWISIATLSTFNKLKMLTNGGDPNVIASAAAKAKGLVLSSDRSRVKRAVPYKSTVVIGGGAGAQQQQQQQQQQQVMAAQRAQQQIAAQRAAQQQSAAPVAVGGLSPSVAAFFGAAAGSGVAAPAPSVPAAQQAAPVAAAAPTANGSVDMATYWMRLMSAGAQPGAVPGVAAASAAPPAPAVAVAAPAPAPATAAAAERSNFNALLQSLQRTTISGPAAAPATAAIPFPFQLMPAQQQQMGQMQQAPFVPAATSPAVARVTAPAPAPSPAPAAAAAAPAPAAGGLRPSQLLLAKAAAKKDAAGDSK